MQTQEDVDRNNGASDRIRNCTTSVILHKSIIDDVRDNTALDNWNWIVKNVSADGEWYIFTGDFEDEWGGKEDDVDPDVKEFYDYVDQFDGELWETCCTLDDDEYFGTYGYAVECPWDIAVGAIKNGGLTVSYRQDTEKIVVREDKAKENKTNSKAEKKSRSNNKMQKNNMLSKAKELIIHNAKVGFIRAASRKSLKKARDAVIGLMKTKGVDKGTIGMVTMFLKTEAGEGLLSVMVGMLLTNFPGMSENEFVQSLAEEMLAEGSSKVQGEIIEMAMDLAGPIVAAVLSEAPSALTGKGRVETNDEEEETEETAVAAKKTRKQ